MSLCKPSGVCSNETYSTMPLADKTPRADYGLIDPNLLAGICHLEHNQNPWAAQIPRLQQPPAKLPLDGHMAHTMCNGAVPDIVPCPPPAYGRHESPFSIHPSPGYSFAPSPSIGSDAYYDVAYGPATPPDTLVPYLLLGGTYDAALECPQENAYIDPADINPCQTAQTLNDKPESAAESNYLGIGVGICDSYRYGASLASSSPCLLHECFGAEAGPVAAESGIESIGGQFFPALPLPYHNAPNPPGKESPIGEQRSLEHDAPSPATKPAPRRGRPSRYSTINTAGKRASVDDETAAPHGDKKRKVLSPNQRICSKCKSIFQDRRSLDEHVKTDHHRPYVCVFHYAGCASRFDAKNEWKRHVSTKHLGLRYWLCTEGSCAQARGSSTHRRSPSLPEFGSIFNRKDLYTQHVRRMHSDAAGQSTTDHKKSTPESDERLRQMQHVALRVRCQLPMYMPCPVESCNTEFRGATAWDDRMEHVAQQHFENAAAGREPPVEFGGPNDGALTNWAQRDDVQIVKQTESGWELCDPLKGNGGGIRRMSPETSEEDAEGEEQF